MMQVDVFAGTPCRPEVSIVTLNSSPHNPDF